MHTPNCITHEPAQAVKVSPNTCTTTQKKIQESPLTPPTRVTMGVYRDRQPQLDDDDDDEDAQEVQEQKENWEWHDAEEDYETDYDVDESRLLCGALASLNLSSACSESGQMLRGLPVPAGKHTRFED